MKEIKYVYSRTPFGWMWQLEIDGHRPFYPCGSIKGLMKFVKNDLNILLDKLDSGSQFCMLDLYTIKLPSVNNSPSAFKT